jgi:hypothetical protein
MRLTGTRCRFSAHDRLTAGQGQQVAFLCGIENIASLYRHLIARLQILKVDGCEVITVHRHIYRAMSYQTMEQTANLRSRIWPWSNRESAVFAYTLGKIRRTRKPPKPISTIKCVAAAMLSETPGVQDGGADSADMKLMDSGGLIAGI